MKTFTKALVAAAMLAGGAFAVATPASAQGYGYPYNDRYYSDSYGRDYGSYYNRDYGRYDRDWRSNRGRSGHWVWSRELRRMVWVPDRTRRYGWR